MTPIQPPEAEPEFRLALLTEEIDFLDREWSSLGDLDYLVRELADSGLGHAPASNAALARSRPHLEDRDLVMTADLPARQFVAHLLEVRPPLVGRWPRGERVTADRPYDPRPLLSVLRKVRGREHREDPPNVAGFYRVSYRQPDKAVGFIMSYGVIEVGPPPHGAAQFRKAPNEEWKPLRALDLHEISFSGPYRSKEEAAEAVRLRP